MNVESLRHLLESGNAFMRPDHILHALEPEQAVMVPAGALHSIAAHVAHMAWWQWQVIQDIETGARQRQRIAGDEFPSSVEPQAWEAVRTDFLSGLERLRALCEEDWLLERPYLERKETVQEVIVDFALHNAYHLGQVVLLRRLLGVWPPAGAGPEAG